jgi:hypothetical protein
MNSPKPFHLASLHQADELTATRRTRLADAARDRRGRHSPVRLGGLSDLFAVLGGGGARPAFA